MRRHIGALLCLAGLALATTAQEERFADAISVREVQVPVRVLVKGTPVNGLTIDNFEIYDRGVLQTITALEVRHLGMAAEAANLPTSDALAEGFAPVHVGRSLLVLLDFGFSGRHDLARSLGGIEEMIDTQLQPADRVAIATWGSGSGLNLLTGFTADRRQVDLALDAVKGMLDAKRRPQLDALAELHTLRFGSAAKPGIDSTYDVLSRELGPTAAMTVLTGPVEYRDDQDGGVDRLQQDPGYFAPIKLRVEVDVTDSIDIAQDLSSTGGEGSIRHLGLALAELASLLRDVGGQKDLFLLSEGFGGPVLESARSLFFLEKAMRALRDSGWTLHAIDVGGVPTIDERAFGSDSMLFMARETGGELVENVRDISIATQKVLRKTEIVYRLSFEPSDPGFSGELNQLEIKLKNAPRKAKVFHRPAYYSPRPHAEKDTYEQRVDVAQWLLTNEDAAELGVEVFAETLADPQGGAATSVAVEIDARSLYAVRDSRRGEFELWLAVFDSEGRIRDLQTATATLDFARLEEHTRFQGLRFVGDLAVAPGDHQLRVLARHSKGGQVFLSSFPLSASLGPSLPSGPIPAADQRPDDEWLTVPVAPRSAYFQ